MGPRIEKVSEQPPNPAAMLTAVLNDPRVTGLINVLMDKMSEPSSRVLIECEPIKLSAEEAKAFVAQDRFNFVTYQLEKARRAGDDELAKVLRTRLAELAKVL